MSVPSRSAARPARRSVAPRSSPRPSASQSSSRSLPPVDHVTRAGSGIDPLVLERASRVIRVLGHPLRLRLLELLEGGERNVTDLVRSTGVGQALVSQQLRILWAEGVVGDRRVGPRVFYRITEPKVSKILACIRECDLPEGMGPVASGSGPGQASSSAPSAGKVGGVDDRPASP